MACESAVDWSDAVTWGLVLVGWTVVHITELAHVRRKEKREVVSSVIAEIKEIEGLAIAFHSSGSYSALASDTLTWRLGRLSRCFQRAPLVDLNMPLSLIVRFKKALILKNTDASSFASQPYYGELIVGVRRITEEMIEAVEAARDRVFK